MTESKLASGSRPVVGLVIDWIGSAFHTSFIKGARDLCRERGADLRVFQTGRLGSPDELEACSNELFTFLPRLPVDAYLFCAANQTNYAAPERLGAICAGLSPRPVVLAGVNLRGFTVLECEDRGAMRALTSHLLREHGKRRIAFIRGPVGIADADERFMGYQDALAEAGVAPDPQLVFQGTFAHATSTEAALQAALAVKAGHADAIMAANDSMAAAARDAMTGLGLRAPDDAALTGFDDSDIAMEQGLSGCAQPVGRLGRAGAEAALALISGLQVPAQAKLMGDLRFRGSCGCAEHAREALGAEPIRRLDHFPFYEIESLNSFSRRLISSIDRPGLAGRIGEEFRVLGVNAAWVGLYEDPTASLETVRPLCDPGNPALSSPERPFSEPGPTEPTSTFLSRCVAAGADRDDRLVLDLFEGRNQIGLLCLRLERDANLLHDVMRSSLSAALKAAGLYASLQRQNRALAVKIAELEDSERRALASEQQALEASKAKSVFLSNMSHELRTPLNSIIGFATILCNKLHGRTEPRYEKFLRNILASGQHLLGLIGNILDLSKIEAGRMELFPERVDLRRVFEDVIEVMKGVAAEGRVTIEVEVPDGLPELHADPGKVKQIMFNLLSNAVKFSPRGATVTVRAGTVSPDAPPLFTDATRIDVVDRGIGIKPEDLDLIFEEFRQVDDSSARRYPGTGLGLTLVRKLLALHGGRVEVVSEPGRGSTFTVFLPLSLQGRGVAALRETIPSPEPTPPAAAEPGVRRTILVVEDEPISYHALAAALEAEGYRVLGARSGEQALQMIESERPALVSLDIVLPGLAGWDTLKELKSRAQTRDIPVVLVTVLANRELGLALGADDFFTKPVERSAFVHRVKELVPPDHMTGPPILVIDDDSTVHDLLEAELDPAGYGCCAPRAVRRGWSWPARSSRRWWSST